MGMNDLLGALLGGSQGGADDQDDNPMNDMVGDLLGSVLSGGGGQAGGAAGLLGGLLGGGSQGGLGGLLGGLLGGGSKSGTQAGGELNPLMAPLANMLADKLGLSPQMAQMVMGFVLGKMSDTPDPRPRSGRPGRIVARSRRRRPAARGPSLHRSTRARGSPRGRPPPVAGRGGGVDDVARRLLPHRREPRSRHDRVVPESARRSGVRRSNSGSG